MEPCIKEALQWAREVFACATPSAANDAEYLLAFVCQRSRVFLYSHPEYNLSSKNWQDFKNLVSRRAQGEPIAYLLGEKEFWSLSLFVTPAVLIPRPETELLVEETLKRLPENTACRILDVGTGSGAIALALGYTRPNWQITGLDISDAALEIAKKNCARHHLENVHLLQSDIYSNLPPGEYFDAIVSNPPYIEELDLHLGQGDLRYEPKQALASGLDGLDVLREIITHASQHLKYQSPLLLEHGYQQGPAVRNLLAKQGFSHIETIRDFQGHERISLGYRIPCL